MARILVIDDTKNIRNMVRLTLEREGHEVQTAEDGTAGLQLFGDGTGWDLVLVDQRMPGEEGRDVIALARRRDHLARLIMMTAFATNELASAVLTAGAIDFLRKPFSTDVLRGAVSAALSRPRNELPPPEPGTAEAAVLPEPGDPAFTFARVSWRINGFSFWPAVSLQTRAEGLDFGKVFQVRKPDGTLGQCFVGITPHIREQKQREAGHVLAGDDPVWEQLCGQALLNYIWENATMPPEALPVFDVPRETSGSGSPVPWGPFGSR